MDVSEPASGLALYIYRLALGDWLVSEVGYANEGHGEDLRALRRPRGMPPGVGKTYRMLQEGHAELENGRDVAIGLLETTAVLRRRHWP